MKLRKKLQNEFQERNGTTLMKRKVSVVIRTRDEENGFERLLKSLATQTIPPSEVIIVDNFYTKQNLQNLQEKVSLQRRVFQKNCKFLVVPVSDREFSHAYSTNQGVEHATHELVCITNAHSLPVSQHWLEDGLKHFDDPQVAGVSGFFIPHQNDIVGRWISPMYRVSETKVLRMDWLSTMNCIIRRSLWERYAFNENLADIVPETERYGLEDYEWSTEMKARGFKVVIDPAFSVFHSHEEGLKEILRNLKNFFVYMRIQGKISAAKRSKSVT